MENKDYLMRQIEQLGAVLRRLLAGIVAQQFPDTDANAESEKTLCDALSLQAGSLASTSSTALLMALQTHEGANEANQDLLAELLLTMADNSSDTQKAGAYRQQALDVLEQLNATSNSYDLERHGKVALLRSLQ